MSDLLFKQIETVFCETFGQNYAGKIDLKTTMEDIPEWDSYSFLDFTMALEDYFDVQFDVDELAQMFKLSTVYDLVKAKRLKE